MYPVEPKPADKPIASLKDVQHIEERHKEMITGHYIKAMTCDPYGHPVFATMDGKVGGLVVHDAVEEHMLRKIGPGYHSVDSCTFDSSHNFIMTSEKDKVHSIVQYNLKGDKLSEHIIEDAAKLFAVSSMADGSVAVALALDNHKNAVRIYDPTFETIKVTIEDDSQQKAYFLKPAYMTTTGNRIAVGDVGYKCIKCFDGTKQSDQLLWSFKMDMPRGMCVDGQGNICACDFRHNKVALLTPDGELIGHAFTGLSKPQFVAMYSNLLYTIDMGKSTSYRLTTFQLYKTSRRHGTKPDWQ